MIEFHALGGITITDSGAELRIGGPRQRRLMAMLLIHRNNVVSVDRLADAVFNGEPTAAASTTLRSYIARIRKVVDGAAAPPGVVTRAPGYLLQLPDERFDVARFERLVAEAGADLGRGDAVGASSSAREALALWRGGAYAEFADEDWARPEAQRLEELRLVAYERMVEAELGRGQAAEVIPNVESLVGDHPLRETFRAQLVVAHYRAGRQADALRVMSDYRRMILEEYGLDPSPALADLERQVLTHDRSLLLGEPAGLPLRGYRLGERLGTGRDGTVFAARLPGVERDFAVRIFRREIADAAEFVRSFEANAHGLASLRHPAIVPVHDYWREPGAAYLVMRRMYGGTLAERLQRGPLGTAAAAALVSRIGEALVAAAERGIGHGRVIPESVFFDSAGDAFLADFALDPADQPRCAGDDVHDLAAMVGACLATDRGAVADVLAEATATVGRPAIAEYVPRLVAALTGTDRAPDRVIANPYKGLRAFDEADAPDFYGRADLLEAIVGRLGRDDLRGRLVLVVGGSGTGKSSVVRAGLLPRVRRGDVPGSEGWFVATMLPGSSPFKELAESLSHVAVIETVGLADELAADVAGIDRVLHRLLPDDGQLLLVVDQFEELFTLAGESDQRAFLRGLMHAVSAAGGRLRVVATLRADFYDRPLAVPVFGAAVNEATVTIAAMAASDLEAAIVGPAHRVGGGIEPALVAELVNAVIDQPAALPSLQFTLYELAERSPDRNLTLAAYRELGGVSGAIASRAEALYQSLEDAERAAVRHMFERLVVVGAEGEPTRRRAARAELSALARGPAIDVAVDRWSNTRLLTLDRHPLTRVPTVELAHEALLREWPRLRRWIEEDREAIVALGHLRDAAAGWAELGRDTGALYRGTRLQIALDIADARVEGLPEQEQEFLDASRAERDREQRDAAQRIERQARANRRLRIQVAAIAVALVVALVGGFVALDQRRGAERERRVATARELAAAADANLAEDPERSMLLALAAIDETRSPDGIVLREAEEALHRAVSASRIALSVPGLGGAVDWSPDGSVFVTEGPEDSGLIDIRDADTGDPALSFHGHDVDVNAVAFNGDGSMLATAGDDGAVRVWDPATGDRLVEVQDGQGVVLEPTFSADGSRLAALWPDDVVRMIDVGSGVVTAEIDGAGVLSVDLSPDGQRVVMGSAFFHEPLATVVDATSGEGVFTLGGEHLDIGVVRWSPDGRWIATGSFDGTVGVWDAGSGERRFTLTGHASGIGGLDWSPDSTRLASTSDDGTARVTEIAADRTRELFSLSAQDTSGGLAGVAFSPDGERLMTGDIGINAVKIWEVGTTAGGEWANVLGVPYAGSTADFTPDGDLVVADVDGTASISDVETGDRLATAGPGESGDVGSLDLSGNGELLAIAPGGTGPVDVWDASTGEHRFAVPTAGDVSGVEWSPDGEVLAIAVNGDDRGEVVIVDRTGAEVVRLVEQQGQRVESLSFSPDGRRLATTRWWIDRFDPAAMKTMVWDWERGEVVQTIGTMSSRAAYDPTGARIAASVAFEGTAEIWNAQTGQRVAALVGPAEITDINYSPDGTTVATGHVDGSVRLWDPESGAEQLVLGGRGAPVGHVVFSADGSTLASVADDGLVRVWALDLDDLMAIANDRLTRTLTDDECRRYLHLERCPRH